jgi:pimeloyl-ACP methyl ester carboxylesterase
MRSPATQAVVDRSLAGTRSLALGDMITGPFAVNHLTDKCPTNGELPLARPRQQRGTTVTDTNASREWPAPTTAASCFGTSSLFRHGTGEPLLTLHAGGGAGAWSRYLERLSERFDVIAPDHPGFGLSPMLDDVDSMSSLVDHYISLLDGLGLDRVSVVGASFGGWLAAEIASTVPARIDRLVLMSPAGLLIPDAPPTPLSSMTPEQVVRTLYQDQAKADAVLAVPPSPEVLAQAERDAAAFARYAMDPPLHNPDLPDRLSRITAPTLVITPDVDLVIPRQHSEAYAAAIEGAELRVLTECGHALYHEQPDLVADEVIAFLTAPTVGP